jgi:uncharacterized protein involved in exopolysaccharide biosynthesis
MGYSAGEEVLPADRASEHLEAVAERWWLVLAAAVLCAGFAYAFSWAQPPRYDATAKVLLSNAEPVNVLQHATAAPSFDPQRDLATAVALVKLDTVADRVINDLYLSMTSTELLAQVRVATEGTTSVLAITARDDYPRRAAKIANAFAGRYVVARRHQAEKAYQFAAALARRRLGALDSSDRRGAQGRALRAQLRQLTTTGWLQTGAAQIVDPASTPTTPAAPRPKFAAVVGAFVGTLLGLAAAVMAGALERRRYRTPSRFRSDEPALRRPDVAAAPYTVGVPPQPLPVQSRAATSD